MATSWMLLPWTPEVLGCLTLKSQAPLLPRSLKDGLCLHLLSHATNIQDWSPVWMQHAARSAASKLGVLASVLKRLNSECIQIFRKECSQDAGLPQTWEIFSRPHEKYLADPPKVVVRRHGGGVLQDLYANHLINAVLSWLNIVTKYCNTNMYFVS